MQSQEKILQSILFRRGQFSNITLRFVTRSYKSYSFFSRLRKKMCFFFSFEIKNEVNNNGLEHQRNIQTNMNRIYKYPSRTIYKQFIVSTLFKVNYCKLLKLCSGVLKLRESNCRCHD